RDGGEVGRSRGGKTGKFGATGEFDGERKRKRSRISGARTGGATDSNDDGGAADVDSGDDGKSGGVRTGGADANPNGDSANLRFGGESGTAETSGTAALAELFRRRAAVLSGRKVGKIGLNGIV
ncbi:MAG: hypothetical protein IKU86_08655, partial [Thermoguttaceae bacterium]|nr:hypothetical protein [Thermoguttaceae bacterium]